MSVKMTIDLSDADPSKIETALAILDLLKARGYFTKPAEPQAEAPNAE